QLEYPSQPADQSAHVLAKTRPRPRLAKPGRSTTVFVESFRFSGVECCAKIQTVTRTRCLLVLQHRPISSSPLEGLKQRKRRIRVDVGIEDEGLSSSAKLNPPGPQVCPV